MKKAIASLFVAACVMAFMSSEASAWVCYSRSANATGWGESPSLRQARRIALYECVIRTYRGNRCWITGCR